MTGAVREYPLAAHWSRLGDTPRRAHRDAGARHRSSSRAGSWASSTGPSVGYDSPLRWWRSSRFLAEKGMGITVGVGLDVQERLTPARPRRRGAALHHPRAALGARRRRRADRHGRPHRRPRPADRAPGTTPSAPRARGTARSGTTTRSASPAACSAWSTPCATTPSPPTAPTRPAWTRS